MSISTIMVVSGSASALCTGSVSSTRCSARGCASSTSAASSRGACARATRARPPTRDADAARGDGAKTAERAHEADAAFADAPLSAAGMEQARGRRDEVKAWRRRPDLVVSSPLTRALQTALVALAPLLCQPGRRLELKLHAPEHRFVLLSRTVDLSSTGAFIRTSRRLPEGAEVVVAFQRGTQRNPLTLNADVVRAGLADGGRSTGIALQFKATSEIDESLLRDLIDRHLS